MHLYVAYIIILMHIWHWGFDYIFQDKTWGEGKWNNPVLLLKHTSIYSFSWLIFWLSLGYGVIFSLIFSLVTFVFHTITDYFTSKWTHDLFEIKHYGTHIPNTGVFTVLGLDQLLHQIQLILTYDLLEKLL